MSVITWAKTVRCDYPECQSIAEVQHGDRVLERALPAGWLDVAASLASLRDPFGTEIRELCSLHADIPISKIIAVLSIRREPVS